MRRSVSLCNFLEFASVAVLCPSFSRASPVLGPSACGESSGPVQQLHWLEGLLHVSISQDWEGVHAERDLMAFMNRSLPEISLVMENKSETWDGPPIPTSAVKSIIGSDLNLEFGGVTARMTFNGNGFSSYPWSYVEDNEAFDTENWVLSRMTRGDQFIARVDFTLKFPAALKGDPAIADMTKQLDTAIGSAVMDKR